MDQGTDIDSKSFEDAMRELETIVKKLESGKSSLEDAIGDYERGMLLKQHCERKLKEARLKVEKIVAQADGVISAEPVEIG